MTSHVNYFENIIQPCIWIRDVGAQAIAIALRRLYMIQAFRQSTFLPSVNPRSGWFATSMLGSSLGEIIEASCRTYYLERRFLWIDWSYALTMIGQPVKVHVFPGASERLKKRERGRFEFPRLGA
jgi:hypothetical protein